ncbi:hypothetical protein CAEBREN_00099 [Caenorhabditis brenneri]|uniref:Sdz-33 F-box domain-containing protein n=1 Tax=Caenorhabditis brenneri TaxID=135651 RepID=G0N3K9_CAEBE|nr:hypothetical protein CAEBREN_00099 [Caenorhabditis brenneri]
MSSSTISLFRLPNTAIKYVLRSSDSREFVIFSTLTDRAKCLAKSIKWKSEWILFNPQFGCILTIYWNDYVYFGDKGPNEMCTLVIKTPRKNETQFTKPEFGVREWLEHFLFIFNHPEVHVQLQNDWVYTLESVQTLLEGLTIDRLEVFDSFEVLRHYPLINYLSLGNNDNGPGLFSPEDLKITRKALLGNIPRVWVNRSIGFNLDTLLMMNCPEIASIGDLISDKELNTFLKLWLKGSHPNLRELSYSNRRAGFRGFKERIVFKGIKYEKKECFNTFLLGEYYISRKADGTMARLLLANTVFRIIFLSILSARAKNLVQSLNRKAVCIEFYLQRRSEITIFTPSSYTFRVVDENLYNGFEDLTTFKLEHTSIFGSLTGISLSLPGYGTREWLEHFMYIFNHSMISLHFADRSEWGYTLESVHKELKGFTIGNLNVREVNENVREVLRLFPVMNALNTRMNSMEDADFMKKLFLGNIPYVDLSLTPMDLDTLLAMNCQDFRSSGVLLSDKDLNMFLKLWLKGSNPNLQSLRLRYSDWMHRDQRKIFNEGIIFKGIKYEKKPENEVRSFQPEILKPHGYLRFSGGYDILRKSDGSRATVLIDSKYSTFSMYLWP